MQDQEVGGGGNIDGAGTRCASRSEGPERVKHVICVRCQLKMIFSPLPYKARTRADVGVVPVIVKVDMDSFISWFNSTQYIL